MFEPHGVRTNATSYHFKIRRKPKYTVSQWTPGNSGSGNTLVLRTSNSLFLEKFLLF